MVNASTGCDLDMVSQHLLRKGTGSLTDPARPRIGADVELHALSVEGDQWILQRGSSRYYRVSGEFADLVRALDGERNLDELAVALGERWTVDDVRRGVNQLRQQEMLDDGRPPRSNRRWRFSPPMTIQFSLVDPSRVLGRLKTLVGVLACRSARVVAGVLGIGGILALLGRPSQVREVLSGPVSVEVIGWVFVAVLGTTALHEFGHGAVLTYFGGRPKRMGVMLFYLAPAFFCDVSDGWRLPHRRQRVQVALAGVATQTVVAGIAGIGSLFVESPEWLGGLILFSVITYVAAIFNLIPFVKFDGYIALMSHLDESGLRARSITDFRRATARALMGGVYDKEVTSVSWSVPYGFACVAFPVLLIAQAANLWIEGLALIGIVGSVLVALALGGAVFLMVRGVVRIAREGHRGGAKPWRITLAVVGIFTATVGSFAAFRVPLDIGGGYFVDSEGEIHIVLPLTTDTSLLEDHRELTFFRNGLVLREPIGVGRVVSVEPSTATGPLSAVGPFKTDMEVPYEVTYLATSAEPLPSPVGAVKISGPSVPLFEWFLRKYLSPVF